MTVSCVTTDNVASQFVVCVTARVCVTELFATRLQ